MDQAAQLLYIIEIIAVWAEQFLKPTISFYLSLLHAAAEPISQEDLKHRISQLNKALATARLPVTAQNFPWLYEAREKRETTKTPHSKNPKVKDLTVPRGSFSNRSLSGGRQSRDRSLSRVRQRSESFSEVESIMPELDEYVWITNRDPGYGDILVIAIDRQGRVQRPFVVFDLDLPQISGEVRRRLKTEKRMYDRKTKNGFVWDENGLHYINFNKRCSSRMSTRNQFYLLCSLDPDKYYYEKMNATSGGRLFDELEKILKIRFS